jgi:hypothetical protein
MARSDDLIEVHSILKNCFMGRQTKRWWLRIPANVLAFQPPQSIKQTISPNSRSDHQPPFTALVFNQRHPGLLKPKVTTLSPRLQVFRIVLNVWWFHQQLQPIMSEERKWLLGHFYGLNSLANCSITNATTKLRLQIPIRSSNSCHFPSPLTSPSQPPLLSLTPTSPCRPRSRRQQQQSMGLPVTPHTNNPTSNSRFPNQLTLSRKPATLPIPTPS